MTKTNNKNTTLNILDINFKDMKQLLILLTIRVFLISCDKDFNNIGTDLVNEEHFDILKHETTTISTENFKLTDINPVQTDNLPYSVLGYYDDPFYGNTNANLVSQVELSEYAKDFGVNPVITKVILTIPYYNNLTETDSDGASTYELDSVYGNTEIQLALYKSDYFLNDFDPNTNFEDRQKYYSNDDAIFAPHSFGNAANLIYTNSTFSVDPNELEVPYTDSDGAAQIKRFSPRLRDSLGLNIADFNWLIDPANATAISSRSEFKDFYRGIYFQTENLPTSPNAGTFFGLDISRASIEIIYEYDDPINSGSTLDDNITIFFRGNRVNTFTNNISYTEDLDKIYLKGGEGALAKIDFFNPNSDEDRTSIELTDIQTQAEDWLINEANIEFYVDQNTFASASNNAEPERIFLYDLDNNRVLRDYFTDLTVNSTPVISKSYHLGRLERNDSGKGVKYKINITQHINNIIKNDSTNVKLGLVISNNVNLLGGSDIKNVDNPDTILTTSITSHQGTVLHNENATDPDKKLKLNIHYTKVN